jgi:hypothetical protein
MAVGALPRVEPRHAAQAILGMANWTYEWFHQSQYWAERVADANGAKLMFRG